MQPPAITVIFLQDGRAVQTAGLDTPVDQQIETLAEAGRLNCSPVPGAIRGEVWISGQVRARTFFEPVAAPDATEAPAKPTDQPTPEDLRRAIAELESLRHDDRAAAQKAINDATVAYAAAATARAEADAAKAELAALKATPDGELAATDSTHHTTEDVEPRADVPGLADESGSTSSPSSPAPPPVSGKRKSS